MEHGPFAGIVWRVAWATRNPLVGSTAGGRWHPPNDFEALYTSLEQFGAMAEIYSHLSKAPVFSSSHVKICRLGVSTERTLAFADIAALGPLGVKPDELQKGVYARTREVGSAARFLDYDALLVPSARWPCANLVLFLDRLKDRDAVTVKESFDVNWPAWRESMAARRTVPS